MAKATVRNRERALREAWRLTHAGNTAALASARSS